MMSSLKNLLLIASLITALSACNNKETTEASTPQVQTALEKTITIFKSNASFPVLADTSLLNKVAKYDSLGSGEIKLLAINWFSLGEPDGNDWELKEFYKIDSIKATGTYTAWCEKLDIGQTKFANAYAIQRMKLDPNTTLLFWALTNSSYEACPYSTSQTLNFSIVYKGAVSATYYLGKYSVYGDPPVSSEQTISGKLNADGTFEMNGVDMGDEDMDQPYIYITNSHYEFVIKDGKIQKLKGNKSERIKTPRPKTEETK